jgi:hypothetical protein
LQAKTARLRGAFSSPVRGARTGRNPKLPGVPIPIPARRAIKFTPGQELRKHFKMGLNGRELGSRALDAPQLMIAANTKKIDKCFFPRRMYPMTFWIKSFTVHLFWTRNKRKQFLKNRQRQYIEIFFS